MREENINSLIYKIIIGVSFFLFVTACEEELETSIGSDLIVDRVSIQNDTIIPITSNTFDVLSVSSSNQSSYLLGSYSKSNFGELNASFATNLLLPTELSSVEDNNYAKLFGDSYLIDAMVITIPYASLAATEEPLTDANNHQNYELQSIVGNTSDAFNIDVYELNENIVNTSSDSENNTALDFNSDKVFAKSQLLYSQQFNASADDKFLLIDRKDENAAVYATDTLKFDNFQPAIRFNLGASSMSYLDSKLIANSSNTAFDSQQSFESYFNGLVVQASSSGADGHVLELSLASSKLEVFYSVVEENERVKKKATYNFGNAKVNSFDRNNASITRESDRIYVQGAAGEEGLIELAISDIDLAKIRSDNWLVTKASFSVFVDQQYVEELPERLYVYDRSNKAHLPDAINGGSTSIDGNLEYETVNGQEVPLKYSFLITEYFAGVLGKDSTEVIQLGIKAYNDTYANTSENETSLDYNWNPRGVVLLNESNVHGIKKLQLTLKFREIN